MVTPHSLFQNMAPCYIVAKMFLSFDWCANLGICAGLTAQIQSCVRFVIINQLTKIIFQNFVISLMPSSCCKLKYYLRVKFYIMIFLTLWSLNACIADYLLQNMTIYPESSHFISSLALALLFLARMFFDFKRVN